MQLEYVLTQNEKHKNGAYHMTILKLTLLP